MFKCIDLGSGETPLVLASGYQHLGVPVFIKREEMCAPAIGCGYDTRKLEFLLVEISASEATDVVVYSRNNSNFTVALARAILQYDVPVHVLFCDDFDPAYTHVLSNLHMARALTYGKKTSQELLATAQDLRDAGRNPFVVDISGNNSLAIMGGFSLFDEIALDLRSKFFTTRANICVGVDSGATLAGMLAARATADSRLDHECDLNLIGVPVFYQRESFSDVVTRVSDNYNKLVEYAERDGHTLPPLDVNQITLVDDNLPRGRISQVMVDAAKEFYYNTGVLLDPIYGFHTAMAALSLAGSMKDPIVIVNPHSPTIAYFRYDADR